MVLLSKPSVMGLRSTVEELVRGEKLRDFYRTFSSRDLVYIAQRRANGYNRFLESLEYGVGGQQFLESYVVPKWGYSMEYIVYQYMIGKYILSPLFWRC